MFLNYFNFLYYTDFSRRQGNGEAGVGFCKGKSQVVNTGDGHDFHHPTVLSAPCPKAQPGPSGSCQNHLPISPNLSAGSCSDPHSAGRFSPRPPNPQGRRVHKWNPDPDIAKEICQCSEAFTWYFPLFLWNRKQVPMILFWFGWATCQSWHCRQGWKLPSS